MTGRPLELAAELAAEADLTQTEMLVYLGLARRADNDTLECYPRRADLAAFARLGYDPDRPERRGPLDTVSRALRSLEKAGLITRLPRPGRSTVYKLSTTARASAGSTDDDCTRQRVQSARASAGRVHAPARAITTKRTTYLTAEPIALACGCRFAPGTGEVHAVDCTARQPPTPAPAAPAKKERPRTLAEWDAQLSELFG